MKRKKGIKRIKRKKSTNRKRSCSKKLALITLIFDCAATAYCLFLCTLCVLLSYTGTLPFLTALIAFMQAMTAAVLNGYYGKAKAENTAGGIVFEAAGRGDESI